MTRHHRTPLTVAIDVLCGAIDTDGAGLEASHLADIDWLLDWIAGATAAHEEAVTAVIYEDERQGMTLGVNRCEAWLIGFESEARTSESTWSRSC